MPDVLESQSEPSLFSENSTLIDYFSLKRHPAVKACLKLSFLFSKTHSSFTFYKSPPEDDW